MNPCVLYAHYYLGCKYRFTWPNGAFVECTLDWVTTWLSTSGHDESENGSGDFEVDNISTEGNFQLILTRLEDMDKEQKRIYYELCKDIFDHEGALIKIMDTPASLDYLFRNGVDAFDLIKKGNALNKNGL